MRLTVMFEPHPWIKRWACSRSWAVAPVLQYFRALRGDFANIIINHSQWETRVVIVIFGLFQPSAQKKSAGPPNNPTKSRPDLGPQTRPAGKKQHKTQQPQKQQSIGLRTAFWGCLQPQHPDPGQSILHTEKKRVP